MNSRIATTGLFDLRGGISSLVAASIADPAKQDELVAGIESLVLQLKDTPDGTATVTVATAQTGPPSDAAQIKAVSEAFEGDAFTRRARPAVLYAGLLFIFLLHVVAPGIVYLQTGASPAQPPQLPTEFWWAWSSVVAVWMLGRSYEKVNRPTRLSNLITGQQGR